VRTTSGLLLFATFVGAIPASVPPAGGPADLSANHVLQDWFGFDAGDMLKLDRRQPVVRSLHTVDAREIATVGVVRVRVSPGFYTARLRDVESLATSDIVLQIGRFGEAARAEDVGALTLDQPLLRALRRCRLHACKVQLSADAIAQLDATPRAAPGGDAAVTRVLQRVLADMVRRYQQAGAEALIPMPTRRTERRFRPNSAAWWRIHRSA
jgi:hypothetical protein